MKYTIIVLSIISLVACVTMTPELNPNYLVYENQCVVDKNESACQVCIEMNPKTAQCPLSLGKIYYNVKKFDEAIEQFEQALVLDPKLAIARNNLGAIYFTQANYQKAIANYLAATRIEPDYADPRMGLALSYFRSAADSLGRAEALSFLKLAAEQLRVLLTIDPEYPQAANALRTIEDYIGQLS